jgi:hypothetical protein
MQRVILIFSLVCFSTTAICQHSAWQKNKASVDSLLAHFRYNGCTILISSIKKAKRKKAFDIKLFKFLEDFQSGILDEYSINYSLKNKFKQELWRFFEIKKQDSLIRYQGRIRSYGNIEAFIGYVVFNDKIIGRRFFFNIRSRLDCTQLYDQNLDDLIYLSEFIPNHINMPLDFSEWYNYFHSYLWKDPSLSKDIETKVDILLSKNSTL